MRRHKMDDIKKESISKNDCNEKVYCSNCGWAGNESELKPDYYDQYSGANDCYLCPNCDEEIDK
jgi:hypothetical protein